MPALLVGPILHLDVLFLDDVPISEDFPYRPLIELALGSYKVLQEVCLGPFHPLMLMDVVFQLNVVGEGRVIVSEFVEINIHIYVDSVEDILHYGKVGLFLLELAGFDELLGPHLGVLDHALLTGTLRDPRVLLLLLLPFLF